MSGRKYGHKQTSTNSRSPVASRHSVLTRHPGHVCIQEWKIENILKLSSDSEVLTKLKVGPRCKTKLFMKAQVTERLNHYDMDIFLERHDEEDDTLRVYYDLELKNMSGEVYKQTSNSRNVSSGRNETLVQNAKLADVICGDIVLASDIRDDEANTLLKKLARRELVYWDPTRIHKVILLKGDHIIISGTIKVYGCCIRTCTTSALDSSDSDDNTTVQDWMTDFEKAFRTGLDRGENLEGFYPDLTIRGSDGDLRCHKFVLAARSQILKRELEEAGDTEELLIEDVDVKTLTSFLLYMYCSAVGCIRWPNLLKLYSLSDRYKVGKLKTSCSRVIIKGVKLHTVTDVLKLANQFSDDRLKSKCCQYLKENYDRIQGTDEWETFVEDNPQLAMDAMSYVNS